MSRKAAARLKSIAPFQAMEILARARALEAAGRSIVHLEIGEPDFPTPARVVEAGIAALQSGKTHYSPAVGITALREAIANHYAPRVRVDASRVVVTPGASGALALTIAALVGPGDQVLMTDPGYPCNRHFVRMFDGDAVSVPVGPDTNYQLTAERVRHHWSERTVAVLLASPANPTGAVIDAGELREIAAVVEERGGALIVDEIYSGLIYGGRAESALAISDRIFVVNSFSKYFGMTGWRVGWLVSPGDWVADIDKLAQNLFLAPNTPAQHAALASLEPGVRVELEHRRAEFQARRDWLLPRLKQLGFDLPLVPQGAFYVYAGCEQIADDSDTLARALLEQVGVAVTPGSDFGMFRAKSHVRFSYANSLDRLHEAITRISQFFDRR